MITAIHQRYANKALAELLFKNIELVGLLTTPPTKLLTALSDGETISAANIFFVTQNLRI